MTIIGRSCSYLGHSWTNLHHIARWLDNGRETRVLPNAALSVLFDAVVDCVLEKTAGEREREGERAHIYFNVHNVGHHEPNASKCANPNKMGQVTVGRPSSVTRKNLNQNNNLTMCLSMQASKIQPSSFSVQGHVWLGMASTNLL